MQGSRINMAVWLTLDEYDGIDLRTGPVFKAPRSAP